MCKQGEQAPRLFGDWLLSAESPLPKGGTPMPPGLQSPLHISELDYPDREYMGWASPPLDVEGQSRESVLDTQRVMTCKVWFFSDHSMILVSAVTRGNPSSAAVATMIRSAGSPWKFARRALAMDIEG